MYTYMCMFVFVCLSAGTCVLQHAVAHLWGHRTISDISSLLPSCLRKGLCCSLLCTSEWLLRASGVLLYMAPSTLLERWCYRGNLLHSVFTGVLHIQAQALKFA